MLDRIDEGILYTLQADARNTTTTEIATRLDVSASTVQNRIQELEADGIIEGYRATVNYEEAGFPLLVLMVCTADLPVRDDLAEQGLEIPGVVNVRELMVGDDNVLVEVVGESNEDLTRIATALTDVGLEVSDEVLIKNEYAAPFDAFGGAGE